jgi:hypothetical protein
VAEFTPALAFPTVALFASATGKMYAPRVLSADEDSLLQIILFGYLLRKLGKVLALDVPRP